ncbi:hypothetical protein [Kaarinaea lacus]
MKRAQRRSIFNSLAGRQVIFVVFAINVSVFSSAHVPARDQGYLDAINAEAQNLGSVDDTSSSDSANTYNRSDNPPQTPSNDQSTFLQQINSQLYSHGDSESAYLKQLENEVKNLPPDSDSQATNTTQSSQSQENYLKAEQETVTQITEAQRKEMELALESRIPGIYRLYKKLGLTQKRLVVKEYLTNEKISTASKTILNLYGGK